MTCCRCKAACLASELMLFAPAVQTPCQKYWPELLKMIQEGTLTPYKVCHPCISTACAHCMEDRLPVLILIPALTCDECGTPLRGDCHCCK